MTGGKGKQKKVLRDECMCEKKKKNEKRLARNGYTRWPTNTNIFATYLFFYEIIFCSRYFSFFIELKVQFS